MAPMPPLLAGRTVAVLGSSQGLGRAVAAACAASGAEVLGIDSTPVFDDLAAFYRFDPADPLAMDAVAAALPEGLDGLALFPAQPAGVAALGPALAAPKQLAALVAPRMAPGGAVVVRAAPRTGDWAGALGLVRAAMALRPGAEAGFAATWDMAREPSRAAQAVGWGMLAFAMAQAWAWPGVRINALVPAAPDGRLTPQVSAARGLDAAEGPALAAQAAVFLLCPLSAGLTGAVLAADGGLSARIQTSLEGL